MNITIVNGAPDETWAAHENALIKVVSQLEVDYTVDLFHSRNMNITYCCGCFSCWVKTPGKCIFKDDMDSILKSIVNADYVIFASPLEAGFITKDTKKVMDRIIPTLLPYLKNYGGECHHLTRYKPASVLGVLLLDNGNLDDEAVDMIYDYFERVSLNMHSDRVIKMIANPENMGVLYDEISHC